MTDKSPDPSSPTLAVVRPTKKQRRSHRQSNSDPKSAPHPPPHDAPESNVSRPQESNNRQHTPLFTAHRQPVPGLPSSYSMNPGGYSMNGSPFPAHPSTHSSFPQPHPSSGGQPSSTTPTDAHPHQHQYAYPNYNYTSHSYPQYPQYPQPIMMYGPPRSHGSHEQPHTSTSPAVAPHASSASTKRKSSSTEHARSSSQTAASSSKRTKTQRACDSCRSRKIRCDILQDAETPICQHCKQYGFECTFFLPITETRFKKKKPDDDGPGNKDEDGGHTASPRTELQKGEVRVYGPTSDTHLIHSQALIPPRTYESYDTRYNHTWEVSRDGDGLIHVHEPSLGEMQLALPKPIDMRVERDMIEKLLNIYFSDIAPIFPVVTQAEFLMSPSPPPILLYSCCLVAAARREIPQSIFDAIRYAANSVIKAEDVLSTASIVNVQSLLILCMVVDSHSPFVPNALSGLWVRLGTAIRMAQDLGLHRAESVKQNIELRRRLWGACVIGDRWISLIYGHPYMIDVQDCDVRLPSSGDPNDPYMDELLRLSVLLGRVLKTIYTPAGLALTNDEELTTLLTDLEAWSARLPPSLQFQGPDTARNAGLLFLLYSCVNLLFWRVFMRISYACPAHLKFSLTIEKWTNLVQLSGDAIDWLDKHENMYDVWALVAYSATSCALVQYHTWARRQDTDAQAKLKKLRDCVRRWEASISPDHMSARRKTAEIIALLYEATLGPRPALEIAALNPTSGVKSKPQIGGLVYKKDATRPGGGIFVAQGNLINERMPDIALMSNTSPGSEEDMSHVEAPVSGSSVESSPMLKKLSGGREAGQNVNPAMNSRMASAPGNVHLMNVLDLPQASNILEQAAVTDMGLLEGIPGGMFDWGQWDTFFSRFMGTDQTGGFAALQQQQQQQHQQRIRDMGGIGSASRSQQR